MFDITENPSGKGAKREVRDGGRKREIKAEESDLGDEEDFDGESDEDDGPAAGRKRTHNQLAKMMADGSDDEGRGRRNIPGKRARTDDVDKVKAADSDSEPASGSEEVHVPG